MTTPAPPADPLADLAAEDDVPPASATPAAVADPPGDADPPAEPAASPREPTEAERVEAAVKALKTRGTPHQVRQRLMRAGCGPEVADRVVNRARARLLADSRKLGARIAEVTVWAMCGSLALVFVPGGEVLLGFALVIGMVVLAVALLVWLSGVGGD